MTQTNLTVPSVVLVHAAWADASSWNKVITSLQRKGMQVVAVQIPLTSLSDDAATVRRTPTRVSGPVVLVGHSYGGAVITAAGSRSLMRTGFSGCRRRVSPMPSLTTVPRRMRN